MGERQERRDGGRIAHGPQIPGLPSPPRPERALGWWEPATLHPAHVRPREEPIAKLGHGQEAGVGAEPLDGGKARIAAKEVEV